MEILGIGPGEFIFILIILLVVVGPERLPDLARQAGKLLVRGRNWLQSSPDAAMVMRARQEIEQELATLRTSLLEVQSVRDEVLGAAKQIGAEVNSLTAATKAELADLGTIAPPKPADSPQETEPAPANTPAEPGAEAQAPPDSPHEPAEQAAPAAEAATIPNGAERQAGETAHEAVPLAEAPPMEQRSNETPHVPTPLVEEPSAEPALAPLAALEAIDVRLQAIMSDLFALQGQLKQRGVLAEDWRPPSWNMQLPDAPPADQPAESQRMEGPPAADEPVETEEAPNVQ